MADCERTARLGYGSYGPELAAAYDALLADAAMPTILRAVTHAMQRFDIAARSVADVGCGTGRLLASLDRPGRRLIGVDRAAPMLAVARRRLPSDRIRLLQQDMRQLRLPRPVDLILCTFATLNYLLRAADLDATFGSFARNLRPGGHLIMDYIPSVQGLAVGKRIRQVVRLGGMRSLWDIAIDGRRGLTRTRITFRWHGAGTPRVEQHVQRWHSPALVGKLLRRNGLMPRAARWLGPGGPRPWRQVVARRVPRAHGPGAPR